jgi:hypothetical protein
LIQGGKIDRSAYSSAYGGIINCRLGSFNTGAMVRLNVGILFLGAGTPAGPSGTTSGSYLYGGQLTYFIDESGAFIKNSVTNAYSLPATAFYPLLTQSAVSDVFQDMALAVNAIFPQRLTIGTERFNEPSALTPVGSNQAINVTGYTKVIVTPASAASISTATFTQTEGVGADFKRNGRLVIEAGNGNLTVNHTASGANTFYLTGTSNITLVTGQILVLMWSETNSSWRQV